MKLYYLLFVTFLVGFGSASWLGDVFTGLNEGLEDALEDHKDILDDVKTKAAEEIAPMVEKGKAYLKKWKNVVEEIKEKLPESDDVKAHLLRKWEMLVEKITDQSPSEKINVKHLMKKLHKISQKLEKLLPKDLFEEMKENLNVVLVKKATEMKSVGPKQYKQLKRVLVNQLGVNVKNFSMQHLKEVVRGAAKVVNKGMKKLQKEVIPKVRPFFKTNGEDNVEEEKKMEKWIKKNFVKPHHKSGFSSWKQTLEKFADGVFSSSESPKPTESLDKDDDTKSTLEDYEMSPDEKEELKKAEETWEKRIEKENEERAAVDKKNEEIKKSAEIQKRRLTGNENWDIYKKKFREQQTKDDPFEDYLEDVKGAGKKVLEGHEDDIAGITSSWISLKKSLLGKMLMMQTKLSKGKGKGEE